MNERFTCYLFSLFNYFTVFFSVASAEERGFADFAVTGGVTEAFVCAGFEHVSAAGVVDEASGLVESTVVDTTDGAAVVVVAVGVFADVVSVDGAAAVDVPAVVVVVADAVVADGVDVAVVVAAAAAVAAVDVPVDGAVVVAAAGGTAVAAVDVPVDGAIVVADDVVAGVADVVADAGAVDVVDAAVDATTVGTGVAVVAVPLLAVDGASGVTRSQAATLSVFFRLASSPSSSESSGRLLDFGPVILANSALSTFRLLLLLGSSSLSLSLSLLWLFKMRSSLSRIAFSVSSKERPSIFAWLSFAVVSI